MKEYVIIDTGFWIALFDSRDKNHLFAEVHFKSLLKKYRLCLSDFIVFETATYLNCSLKRHDIAVKFLKKVKDCGLKVWEVDKTVKSEALDLFVRYSDKTFSITDCTSFVIMIKNRITRYAGFDEHFEQMDFLQV